MARDCIFDDFDALVWGAAATALARGAEEVPVLTAVADRVLQDQPVLCAAVITATAPERALEIVRVLAVALNGRGMRIHDVLNAVEELPADDCLVAAGILDAVVHGDA